MNLKYKVVFLSLVAAGLTPLTFAADVTISGTVEYQYSNKSGFGSGADVIATNGHGLTVSMSAATTENSLSIHVEPVEDGSNETEAGVALSFDMGGLTLKAGHGPGAGNAMDAVTGFDPSLLQSMTATNPIDATNAADDSGATVSYSMSGLSFAAGYAAGDATNADNAGDHASVAVGYKMGDLTVAAGYDNGAAGVVGGWRSAGDEATVNGDAHVWDAKVAYKMDDFTVSLEHQQSTDNVSTGGWDSGEDVTRVSLTYKANDELTLALAYTDDNSGDDFSAYGDQYDAKFTYAMGGGLTLGASAAHLKAHGATSDEDLLKASVQFTF